MSHNTGMGQSRHPTCYNCGADDHFMMACPEPTRQVPAGLAAARAAQASQVPHVSSNTTHHQDHRPFKRQKTGPIVTRYPAPNNGPIVTRYAPPVNHNAIYGPGVPSYSNSSQGYQQSYSQQPPYGHQQTYAHPMPQQQPGNYNGPYTNPQNTQSYYQPVQGGGPSYSSQSTGPPRYSYPPGQSVQPSYGFQGPHPPAENYSIYPPSAGPQAPPYYQPGITDPQGGQYSPYQSQTQQYSTGWGQNHSSPSYSGPPHHQPTLQQRSSQKYRKPLHQKGQFAHHGPQVHPFPPSVSPVHPPVIPPSDGNLPDELQRTSSGNLQGSANSDANQGTVQQVMKDLSPVSEDEIREAELQWSLEKIFVEIKQRPADPIAHPLPDVFTEHPILPPAYDATHLSCKYVRPGNLEIFTLPVEKSLHWATLRFDPVFKKLDLSSSVVSLDDLEMWVRDPYSKLRPTDERSSLQASISRKRGRSDEPDVSTHPMETSGHDGIKASSDGPGFAHQSDSRHPFHPPASDVTETANVARSQTPTVDRQGSPAREGVDDAWVPQPGEGRTSSPHDQDPAENLLASLGVSGPPRPLIQTQPSFQSSTSPGRQVSQSESMGGYKYRPNRQDSGYVSARGSYSNGSNSEYCSARGEQSEQWIEHPPPPPPPPPRHHDGTFNSPFSDDSIRNGTHRQDQTQEHPPDSGNSPLTPTSAELLGQQPGVTFDIRNGRKPEPLRQVDDVTPKLKRRQPRVDEVYSRRW